MAARDLRVISIGLDPTIALADPSRGNRGDSRRRQEEYAELVASYTAIVKTPDSPAYSPHRWGNHVILPTLSRKRWLFPIEAYRFASAACLERGADLVVTQDPFFTGLVGYALKRRRGVPLCVQFHSDNIGSEWWLRETPKHRPMEALGIWIARRADTLQVVSATIGKRLEARGVDPGRIWNVMAAGGIDVESFRQANGAQVRARLLGDRYRRIVLFVGRVEKVKDLPTLLEAAAAVLRSEPDTLFLLLGDGEERTRLGGLVRQLGLEDNVVLPGGISADETPAYFAACDLFVMCSLYEGKARSLIEAACAGKPIVTTDVSGADEVVADGETGYVVPIRDPATLADRILRLLQDDRLAQTMGLRGQEMAVRQYDRRHGIEKISQIWEATAKCKKTAARTRP